MPFFRAVLPVTWAKNTVITHVVSISDNTVTNLGGIYVSKHIFIARPDTHMTREAL